MPKRKRVVHERTENWLRLRQHLKWPEQVLYELVRPVVVFGETAANRARATGATERTTDRAADRFDAAGMRGLLPTDRPAAQDDDLRRFRWVAVRSGTLLTSAHETLCLPHDYSVHLGLQWLPVSR